MVLLQSSGGFDPIIILIYGALFAVIYFFFIRPQTKKAKEQQAFIEKIEKGDKIVTTGGIHGKVARIEYDAFFIEVDSNVKLKIEKSAVSMELSRKAYPDNKTEKTK
ncbi:MAG: preprotein translocase subunit YajC [Chitinophagales bacterium]|nr:preprotein translocase subunit YajC [Chitinophagales bacterium]